MFSAGFFDNGCRRVHVRAGVGEQPDGRGWRHIALFEKIQDTIIATDDFGLQAQIATAVGFHGYWRDHAKSPETSSCLNFDLT